MIQTRKELAQKERKIVFVRDIVTKNPIFSKENIEDLFEMFNLYCDAQRRCDISDILNTAKTLGFEKKYKIFYDALIQIKDEQDDQSVDFQSFLKLVTEKIGNPNNEEGRQSMFTLVSQEKKEVLQFADLKRVSEQLKFNLSDQQLQQVINNVAGFGKKQITWDQFNKYIAKKTQKK